MKLVKDWIRSSVGLLFNSTERASMDSKCKHFNVRIYLTTTKHKTMLSKIMR